jgi:hypothetical protein
VDGEFFELYVFKWTSLLIPPTNFIVLNLVFVIVGVSQDINSVIGCRVPCLENWFSLCGLLSNFIPSSRDYWVIEQDTNNSHCLVNSSCIHILLASGEDRSFHIKHTIIKHTTTWHKLLNTCWQFSLPANREKYTQLMHESL